MIRCTQKHLQQRAQQRGYTWDQVKSCIVEYHENKEITVNPNHKDYPKKGLGDYVADGLKKIGITEERVKRITGKKDCGCAKRRAALNNLGKRFFKRK
jgi:hypothetical protein